MKKLLFATVVLAPLATAAPARAQLITSDIISHVYQNLGITNQMAELAKWGQQLQSMQQQYQQLMAIYYAASHVTDLGSAVGALGVVGIQNPLPVNPWALQGVINGTGGTGGMIGNLSGLIQTNQANNHFYPLTSNGYAATSLNQQAQSIGGIQGVAMQIYQSMAQRLPLLQQLQARIATDKEPADRDALRNQMLAEQNNISSLTAQAQSLGILASAQYQANDLRDRQMAQQQIDSTLADARSHGWWP